MLPAAEGVQTSFLHPNRLHFCTPTSDFLLLLHLCSITFGCAALAWGAIFGGRGTFFTRPPINVWLVFGSDWRLNSYTASPPSQPVYPAAPFLLAGIFLITKLQQIKKWAKDKWFGPSQRPPFGFSWGCAGGLAWHRAHPVFAQL